MIKFYLLLSTTILVFISITCHSSQTTERDMIFAAINMTIISLEMNPNQFHITINSTSTGVLVNNSGGTGINIANINGGGTGSTTVGLSVGNQSNTIDFEIVKQELNHTIKTESERTISILTDIKKEIVKGNKEGTKSLLDKLEKTYLPPVVTNILSTLILKFFLKI